MSLSVIAFVYCFILPGEGDLLSRALAAEIHSKVWFSLSLCVCVRVCVCSLVHNTLQDPVARGFVHLHVFLLCMCSLPKFFCGPSLKSCFLTASVRLFVCVYVYMCLCL